MKKLFLTGVLAICSILIFGQAPENVFIKTNFLSSEDKSLYLDQTFMLSLEDQKLVHCYLEDDGVNYCEIYDVKLYKDVKETDKVYKLFIKATDEEGKKYKMIFNLFKENTTCTVFYLDMLSLGDYSNIKK